MDVVNASMYDGASALAEALLMGLRIARKKKRVAVSRAIHPHYRAVVRTYLQPAGFEIVELDCLEDGRTDLSGLEAENDLAAVALQSPNFFGVIEDLTPAGTIIHGAGALFVACFSEPLAYGLLNSPGACGADIVCGEGQSFGIAPSFGGPGWGCSAARKPIPATCRTVGWRDQGSGRPTRLRTDARHPRQHIRREKATSNICSNQGSAP
jgi:glycine dehydrogenase subunit 1